MTDATQVLEQLRQLALNLGFTQMGVVTAQAAPNFKHLLEWVQLGYAGTMSYIPNRLDAYRHPNSVLDDCKSILMLAMPYAKHPDTLPSKSDPRGSLHSSDETSAQHDCKIGSYASGQADYHDLLRDRLNHLSSLLGNLVPNSISRGVVDTAPLMERDFAQMAGLGWIGKNTLLLNRDQGSYFFLSALLTTAELPANEPYAMDHCGSCTACLEVCPTQAFAGPHVLNASRCISYLTIEHRGVIAPDLSDQMQDWIFGCDACQIVCPWNRKPLQELLPELQHEKLDEKLSLEHWLTIDQEEFRRLYRKTPFWRTKLAGMQRNAMIAAANTHRHDLRHRIEKFEESEDETLRETSRWCLKKLDNT
jgi:epoxyqueuosine reductase